VSETVSTEVQLEIELVQAASGEQEVTLNIQDGMIAAGE